MSKTNIKMISGSQNIRQALAKFISIRTDHPNPNYSEAIKFLEQLSNQLNLQTERIHLIDNKYTLLVKHIIDETKPNILLNCHIDVVPIDETKWNTPPFELTNIEGKNYGRGTQDMKSLGIMYLFAIKRLMDENHQLNHNIIICFVPDEEIMGLEGMNLLTSKLPAIAFGLDEGIPSENKNLILYYGERKPLWVKMYAKGDTGHGSKYIKNNCVVRLQAAIAHILKTAEKEQEKFQHGENLSEVTTINLNYFRAGDPVSYNVIPNYCEAGFDIRVTPTKKNNFDTMTNINLQQIREILLYCKDRFGIEYEFINGTDIDIDLNVVTDTNNPYVRLIETIVQDMKIPYKFDIFPAATDSRFLRNRNVQMLGVSPIRNTPNLLHDHNEYILDVSLDEGVEFYCRFLKKL